MKAPIFSCLLTLIVDTSVGLFMSYFWPLISFHLRFFIEHCVLQVIQQQSWERREKEKEKKIWGLWHLKMQRRRQCGSILRLWVLILQKDGVILLAILMELFTSLGYAKFSPKIINWHLLVFPFSFLRCLKMLLLSLCCWVLLFKLLFLFQFDYKLTMQKWFHCSMFFWYPLW